MNLELVNEILRRVEARYLQHYEVAEAKLEWFSDQSWNVVVSHDGDLREIVGSSESYSCLSDLLDNLRTKSEKTG